MDRDDAQDREMQALRKAQAEGQTPTSVPCAAITSLRRKLGDVAEDPAYIFIELRVGHRMPKG